MKRKKVIALIYIGIFLTACSNKGIDYDNFSNEGSDCETDKWKQIEEREMTEEDNRIMEKNIALMNSVCSTQQADRIAKWSWKMFYVEKFSSMEMKTIRMINEKSVNEYGDTGKSNYLIAEMEDCNQYCFELDGSDVKAIYEGSRGGELLMANIP